jgi:hypothetical protein
VAAGVYKRHTLSERVKTIKFLIKEADKLCKGITLYKKPIGEITKALSSPPFKDDFNEKLSNEAAFSVVYSAVNEIKSSPIGSENTVLDRMTAELEDIKIEAEKDLNEKGILYIKTSVCLALLFIVIML